MKPPSSPDVTDGVETPNGGSLHPAGSVASVLDACCGGKMFWFDRHDKRVIFCDKRRETHTLPDASSRGGERTIVVNPDVLADFTTLPFPDNRFSLVVLDPPHLARNGRNGWMAKKYGTLGDNWREELTKGFEECFRVLIPAGTLIFKWNEDEISVQEILKLTPARPLFGSRYGRHYKSHWIVFQKPLNDRLNDGENPNQTTR